jgi:cytochrome c peroxidase
MKYLMVLLLLCGAVLTVASCKKETKEDPTDPSIPHDTTPYVLEIYDLPQPQIATDNQLTIKGVELGRKLFYDNVLSLDETMNCASCHIQEFAFSDTSRFSIGVEGEPGGRQSMSVVNMAWNNNEFFWDGRAHLLRDQVVKPIQDPLELNLSMDELLDRLNNHADYPKRFKAAFGTSTITEELLGLALEQFCNSIVSGDNKYDQFLAGTTTFTESEERGMDLFFAEFNPGFPDLSGADCAHCHAGKTFENDQYMNNALDADGDMEDFGRFETTESEADKGKFKVPTLRNVALTPPYMHDGRFNTLEEVIQHYNTGMTMSSTIDPALIYPLNNGGFQLNDQDVQDLVAFLNTLTDETLITNPAYANPF